MDGRDASLIWPINQELQPNNEDRSDVPEKYSYEKRTLIFIYEKTKKNSLSAFVFRRCPLAFSLWKAKICTSTSNHRTYGMFTKRSKQARCSRELMMDGKLGEKGRKKARNILRQKRLANSTLWLTGSISLSLYSKKLNFFSGELLSIYISAELYSWVWECRKSTD